MPRLLFVALLIGLLALFKLSAQERQSVPAIEANNPLDDRTGPPPAQAYQPTTNAYVVGVFDGQTVEDVRRAAVQVLGSEVVVERLFSEVSPEDDPEGLSRLFRVVASGAVDSGTQWDAAYRIKDAGSFEEVEPDTETAIEDGRKRQAATAACLTNAGVATPDDPAWSHKHMNVMAARALPVGPGGLADGEGVRVCHPDSGWTDHVDLDVSRIDTVLSLNLMEGGTNARDPLNYSGNPGHGTATGSVIISSGDFDSNGQPGAPGSVNGLAPKSTLVPIRAFRSVIHVFDSDIAKAVQHASRAQCDVISMSLGGKGFFGLKRAIKDAVDRDIIVVSAAGNCAGFVVAPASYDNVIAVAATNAAKQPWPGSSQGRAIRIAAPGEDVWVARADGGGSPGTEVGPGNGTSFATAAVAGAAANWLSFHGRDAIKAAQGNLSRQRLFMMALAQSANAGDGWNTRRMGAGILDLEKLLSIPLPNAAGMLVAPHQSDPLTDLARRFDLDRAVVEQGVKRILGHPADFNAMLDAYGMEIIDIATRDPDAFLAAIRPVPAGALAAPPTLIPQKGSERLQRAVLE